MHVLLRWVPDHRRQPEQGGMVVLREDWGDRSPADLRRRSARSLRAAGVQVFR